MRIALMSSGMEHHGGDQGLSFSGLHGADGIVIEIHLFQIGGTHFHFLCIVTAQITEALLGFRRFRTAEFLNHAHHGPAVVFLAGGGDDGAVGDLEHGRPHGTVGRIDQMSVVGYCRVILRIAAGDPAGNLGVCRRRGPVVAIEQCRQSGEIRAFRVIHPRPADIFPAGVGAVDGDGPAVLAAGTGDALLDDAFGRAQLRHFFQIRIPFQRNIVLAGQSDRRVLRIGISLVAGFFPQRIERVQKRLLLALHRRRASEGYQNVSFVGNRHVGFPNDILRILRACDGCQ